MQQNRKNNKRTATPWQQRQRYNVTHTQPISLTAIIEQEEIEEAEKAAEEKKTILSRNDLVVEDVSREDTFETAFFPVNNGTVIQREESEREVVPLSTPKKKKSKEHTGEKKSRKEVKRERKAREQEEVIDSIINTPKQSFLELLFSPYVCMVKEAMSEHHTVSLPISIVWIILRWLVFGTALGLQIVNFVNSEVYSFSRFNFTQTAWLAIRIALLGILIEAILLGLGKACTSITKFKMSIHDTIVQLSLSAWFMILLYGIAIGLSYLNPMYGLVSFLVGIIMGLILRSYAYEQSIGIIQIPMLVAFIVTILLSAFAISKLVPTFAGDVLSILASLIK